MCWSKSYESIPNHGKKQAASQKADHDGRNGRASHAIETRSVAMTTAVPTAIESV